MRRRAFGIAGVSTMAWAALQSGAFADPAEKKGAEEHGAHHAAFTACAKACSECQRACDSCTSHCAQLLQSGHKDHLTTLESCQDCADFCVAAAQIVSRGGPFAALICEACAEACARCGKACEKFPDDKHMKMCAEECQKCEKACREMVLHAGHAQKA